MIRAFMTTTQLTAGQQVDFLAAGTHRRLVTDAGVAIPTALVAHLFEGRIAQAYCLRGGTRAKSAAAIPGNDLKEKYAFLELRRQRRDGQVGVSPTPVHQDPILYHDRPFRPQPSALQITPLDPHCLSLLIFFWWPRVLRMKIGAGCAIADGE